MAWQQTAMNGTGLPTRNGNASTSAAHLNSKYELSDDLNRRQIEVKFFCKNFQIIFDWFSVWKRNMVEGWDRIQQRLKFNEPTESINFKNNSNQLYIENPIKMDHMNTEELVYSRI